MNFVYAEMPVLLPLNLKCLYCTKIHYEGTPMKMFYEKLGGTSTILGARLHRFYTECVGCETRLIFRSSLLCSEFVCEQACKYYNGEESEERTEKLMKRYNRTRFLDPWKLLGTFPDDESDNANLVDKIEKALYIMRRKEQVRRRPNEEMYEAMEKEIRKSCDLKNSEEPLVWDDGETQMSPFVKKLSRVLTKNLGDFLWEMRRYLETKMFRMTAFDAEIFMANVIRRYDYFTGYLLKEKKKEPSKDRKELVDSKEQVLFQKAVETHWKGEFRQFNEREPRFVVNPVSVLCEYCSHHIPKGKKLNMDLQTLGTSRESQSFIIRTPIYRFFFPCPKCNADIVIRSTIQQNTFVKEGNCLNQCGKSEIQDENTTEALDPFTLLNPCRKWEFEEFRLMQEFENLLIWFYRNARMGKESTRRIKAEIEMEIENYPDATYQAPSIVNLAPNILFSDILQTIPKSHFWRFLGGVQQELYDEFDADYESDEETPISTPPPEMEQHDKNHPGAFPDSQPPEKPFEISDITCCHSSLLPVQLMTVPTTLQCTTCRTIVHKGQKLDMRQEWLKGLRGLPVNIYRIYMRCPTCTAHITLRSELVDKMFGVEYGAIPAKEDPEKILEVSSAPAFNPMDLIGRWPNDTIEHLEKMLDLEEKLTRVVIANDDSAIMNWLKERIEKEEKPDENRQKVTKVAMPDASSTMSPFVSYFIADPLKDYDMCLMRGQLRTDEFRRVIEEKRPGPPGLSLPPIPNSQPATLQNLLARYCPCPSNEYSNLFKYDRRRETDLRRPELVERRRKELEQRQKQLK